MRKEHELQATVKLPAEAESFKVQIVAEAKRTQTVEIAKAEAERIKKVGSAEAHAIVSILVYFNYIPLRKNMCYIIGTCWES